jgi:ribosomal protection tetracycline resistance protein
VYVERVSGVGESYAQVPTGNASVGLRVEPAPVGSGLGYRLAVERGWLIPSFHTAIEETLPTELRQGLYGWAVTDLVVTLTESRYSAPTPPAGYFRSLTSDVLREALQRAGTTVCAPASDLELEVPTSAISVVLHELQAVGAAVHATDTGPTRVRIAATVATERVQRVEQRLPDLTGGLGFVVSRPAGYEPVIGPPPVRRSAGRPGGGAVRSAM